MSLAMTRSFAIENRWKKKILNSFQVKVKKMTIYKKQHQKLIDRPEFIT